MNLRSVVYWLFVAGLAASGAGNCSACRGDEFLLGNGGRIYGRWLNRESVAPQQYEISVAGGGKLILGASQVRQTIERDRTLDTYGELLSRCPDNVDGHWQLSQWCLERGLKNRRAKHLRRVIQLQPDHVRARHGLGYSQVRGQWVTQDQFQRRRGYVLHEGRWRLPQEITLLDKRKAAERTQKNWLVQLRRWRELLGTEDARKGHDAISSVRDPNAVEALALLLDEEPYRQVKMLYVEVLAAIGSPQAVETLLHASLYDRDEEIFHASLDAIVRLNPPHVTEKYVEALKDENNVRLNRAAFALGRFEDKSVLSPLIDALVTTHYIVIPERSDHYTTGFASPVLPGAPRGSSPLGGTSFSAGDETKVISRIVNNQQVLEALIRLSGGANFEFNKRAWRYWLANENRKSAPQLDWRRD